MGFGTLRSPGEMAFVLIFEPYGTSLPETIGHNRIGGGQTVRSAKRYGSTAGSACATKHSICLARDTAYTAALAGKETPVLISVICAICAIPIIVVIGTFVASPFPRIATAQRMAPGNAGIIILIRQEVIVIRIIGNMAKYTIPFTHGRASFPANAFQPNTSILDEARGSLNAWMQTSRRNANPMQGTPPSKSSRCCGVTATLDMA